MALKWIKPERECIAASPNAEHAKPSIKCTLHGAFEVAIHYIDPAEKEPSIRRGVILKPDTLEKGGEKQETEQRR